MKHCSTKEQIIELKLREGSLYLSTREEPETLKFLRSKTSIALISQQDLTRDSRWLLDSKLNYAIKYKGSFNDYRIIKRLSELNGEQSIYLTLALVLYFMDEVSRCPNKGNISWFTAATMCGLDDPDLKDKRIIKMRLINTLKMLGIFNAETRSIVGTWCSNASGFKIAQFKQDRVETDKPGIYESVGAYVQFAEAVGKPNQDDPYVQVSDLIAVALGRKEYMRQFKDSPLAAYRDVERLLNHPEEIARFKNQGAAIRKTRLLDVVKNAYSGVIGKPLNREKKDFFRKFLGGIPFDALRILQAENYSIALTEDNNFSNLLPNRPELRDNAGETYDIIRNKCDGVRFGTYRTILTALHGNIRHVDPLQIMFSRQTICHESVHVAFAALKIRNNPELHGQLDYQKCFIGERKGEILVLKDDIYAFFKTMKPKEYAEFRKIMRKCNLPLANYIDPETVGIVANYDLHDGKYFTDDGMEEALASLYSAWNTEREIFYGNNPKLPELRKIATRLDSTMHKIANELAGPAPQREQKDIKPRTEIRPKPRIDLPGAWSTIDQQGIRA